MNAKHTGNRDDSAPATLGDLLRAGDTASLPPESDWTALVSQIAAGDQLSLHMLYERAHRQLKT